MTSRVGAAVPSTTPPDRSGDLADQQLRRPVQDQPPGTPGCGLRRRRGLLFPAERDGLEQAGYQRGVPDLVDAAGQSIVDHVFQELAGILGGGLARTAVAWQRYADGILDKSSQYAAGMQGIIQSPNWAVTREYY